MASLTIGLESGVCSFVQVASRRSDKEGARDAGYRIMKYASLLLLLYVPVRDYTVAKT